jgi:hypothetical protein
MAKPVRLQALAARVAGAPGRPGVIPAIEKELLHYEILDELVLRLGPTCRSSVCQFRSRMCLSTPDLCGR